MRAALFALRSNDLLGFVRRNRSAFPEPSVFQQRVAFPTPPGASTIRSSALTSGARLAPSKIHHHATNPRSIEVQVSQFDVLSHSIQQKPNARINRRAINVEDKSRATASPVE